MSHYFNGMLKVIRGHWSHRLIIDNKW